MNGGITSSVFNSHCPILISFVHMAHWLLLIPMIILISSPTVVTERSVWPWCVTLGGCCSVHRRQHASWTRHHRLKYIQSSLGICGGLVPDPSCRYQNSWMLKSLLQNGIVFACNLCTFSHIL